MSPVQSALPVRNRLPFPVLVSSFLAVAAVVTAGVVYGRFGSLGAARAYAEGRDLSTATPVIDLGELPPFGESPFQIKLTNPTHRAHSVIGTNGMCRCRLDTPLPAEVPPGGELVLDVWINIPFGTKPGPGECEVEFVTDASHALLLPQVVRYVVR